MQRITILGATGSIGVSTLDVLSRHPDRYTVYALTAHDNVEALAAQCEKFHPQVAVVGTPEAAQALQRILRQKGLKTEVEYGKAALCKVASAPECDAVMAAIVGAAGLEPTLAAARAGKKILLANKEALVMSGQLFMDAVTKSGAMLLPIDSEHNAIFQCLPDAYQRSPGLHGVAKVMLTASGGPFLTRPTATLDLVTPEEAVAHPKWVMGRKISVDSATMMNKGLEVIEAHWLFGVSVESDRSGYSSPKHHSFNGILRRRIGDRTAGASGYENADCPCVGLSGAHRFRCATAGFDTHGESCSLKNRIFYVFRV